MGLGKINNFIEEVKQTKEVDTTKWKEFKLTDIFPDYDHGQRLIKADRILGDLPLITAGQFNNGIAQNVKQNKNNKIFKDCVTIDMFGNCFYQEGKFICDDNVYPIKNIKNKFVGLFLASIFNKFINFDFKKQFRLKHLVDVEVKLPVDKNGKLDWKYMEDYIKNILHFYKKINLDKLEKLLSKIKNETKIGTTKWKEFRMKDLFEISGTTTTPINKIRENPGNSPYVTTQATNNGIKLYSSIHTEKGNVLVIDSAVLGWMSYQEIDFSASDHVEKLTPKFKLNKEMGLFIISVWNSIYTKEIFNYKKKASQKAIKECIIPLPIDKNGKPDWIYMKNYIQNIYKGMKEPNGML